MKNRRAGLAAGLLACAFASTGCSESNPHVPSTAFDFGSNIPHTDGGTIIPPPLPTLDDAGVPVTMPDLAGIDLAADMTMLNTCQKDAVAPLTWYIKQGIVLQNSGPFPVVVPDGIQLHGTVSIPSLPAGGTFLGGLIQGTDFASGTMFKTRTVTVTPDGKGFTYSLVVPAATYDMQNRFSVTMPGGATINRYSEDMTTVCDATTHDMVLPAFPALTSATVTVKDMRTLDPPVDATQPVGAIVYFENATHTYIVNAPLTINATTGNATATVPVTSESLQPSVEIYDLDKTTDPVAGGYTTTMVLPTVGAASTYSLTMPTLVKLTGTLTSTTGLLAVANPATVDCTAAGNGDFIGESADATVVTGSTYKAYYRKDAECTLAAVLSPQLAATGSDSANNSGDLLVPLATPPSVTLSADRTTNITPPQLGTIITLAGTVRDVRGAPLPGRTIRIQSSSLSNIPGAVLVIQVVSDAAGNFTASALQGTYYIVVTTYTE